MKNSDYISLKPFKAMALHNKISSANTWGHKKSPNDAKSTPFFILDVPECRKAMLKFVDDQMDPEQKQAISDAKADHLKNCHECFRVFRNNVNLTKSVKQNNRIS